MIKAIIIIIMRFRTTLMCPRSIAGVPSSWALPGLAEVDETESRWTATDSLLGDYLEGSTYSMEEDNMMG